MAEVAKCPKCGKSIDESHEYSWCSKCGEPLSDEIIRRLPALASILAAGALAESGAGAPSPQPSFRSSTGDFLESYKVVPFIGRVKTGFFSLDNANTVSQQLSAAIERETVGDWVFHSLAKVDIELKPGCFAALFGARISYITFDQLIFRAVRGRGPDRDPPLPASSPSATPLDRANERAQGILRCKRCDHPIPLDARQVCRDQQLCEDHL